MDEEEQQLHDLLASCPGDFETLSNGRLRCSLTGHEMLPRLALLKAHMDNKRFKAAKNEKKLLKTFEPNIIQSLEHRDKLLCTLTGKLLPKSEDAVWQHMMGARFHRALAAKEAQVGLAKLSLGKGTKDTSGLQGGREEEMGVEEDADAGEAASGKGRSGRANGVGEKDVIETKKKKAKEGAGLAQKESESLLDKMSDARQVKTEKKRMSGVKADHASASSAEKLIDETGRREGREQGVSRDGIRAQQAGGGSLDRKAEERRRKRRVPEGAGNAAPGLESKQSGGDVEMQAGRRAGNEARRGSTRKRDMIGRVDEDEDDEEEGDADEANFWMPDEGERWDGDEGGDRWGDGEEGEPDEEGDGLGKGGHGVKKARAKVQKLKGKHIATTGGRETRIGQHKATSEDGNRGVEEFLGKNSKGGTRMKKKIGEGNGRGSVKAGAELSSSFKKLARAVSPHREAEEAGKGTSSGGAKKSKGSSEGRQLIRGRLRLSLPPRKKRKADAGL
eukprot:TRINITY_DN1021_c3_g1_i1.p1 TRINITY_DN1021_c3_g1~~TRINITY_DN1021_c3_g1_i1.p1  ORF type:complete len:524 (-),score=144.72 TRINITY_DN1021_c3_g1_i1:465-1976(-)